LFQHGKASIGDLIYRYISSDQLYPECLLEWKPQSTYDLKKPVINLLIVQIDPVKELMIIDADTRGLLVGPVKATSCFV
jgi:hypothetical protein